LLAQSRSEAVEQALHPLVAQALRTRWP
jgi:hypothetical protein